jgi:hypothetical protein
MQGHLYQWNPSRNTGLWDRLVTEAEGHPRPWGGIGWDRYRPTPGPRASRHPPNTGKPRAWPNLPDPGPRAFKRPVWALFAALHPSTSPGKHPWRPRNGLQGSKRVPGWVITVWRVGGRYRALQGVTGPGKKKALPGWGAGQGLGCGCGWGGCYLRRVMRASSQSSIRNAISPITPALQTAPAR